MDLISILENLPEILKWASIIGTLSLIWFYGAIIRRGVPKLSFVFSMLVRLGLGTFAIITAVPLAPLIPVEYFGVPPLLAGFVGYFVAGVVVSLVLLTGFYLVFYVEKKSGERVVKGFKSILQDNKRLAGVFILLVFSCSSLAGLAMIQTGRIEGAEGLMGPIGALGRYEDSSCLSVRSIMEDVDIMGEDSDYPVEDLGFVTKELPGYVVVKAAKTIVDGEGYVLVVALPDSFSDVEEFSPEIISELKFCSVKEEGMALCGCSGAVSVADILVKEIPMGEEGQSLKSNEDSVKPQTD